MLIYLERLVCVMMGMEGAQLFVLYAIVRVQRAQ